MNIKEILEYNKPYNEQNLNLLIKKIKSNSIVPYIGAGMSMLFDSVYPLWGTFLDVTFDKFCINSNKSEFDQKSFEDKADFLYSELGDVTFANHLKAIFNDSHLECELKGFESKAICALPKIFDKGLILTTNYDKVIEKIYTFYHKPLTSSHPGHFEALNCSLRDNELLLFKFHGDISEPSSSIILSKEQYNKAYSNPDLVESLKRAYLSKSMLFLGCSLSTDRSLDILKDVCSDGISHFAIIPCDKDVIKERRVSLEKELYTQSVIYPNGKHECVKVLLDYIANAINPQHNLSISDKISSINTDNYLTNEWFTKQNNVQIKNLGNRYSPDLNVEVEISMVFDALSKNDKFIAKFSAITDELLNTINKLKIKDIDSSSYKISKLSNNFVLDISKSFPYSQLLEASKNILMEIEKAIKYVNDDEDKIRQKINTHSIGEKNGNKDKLQQQLNSLRDVSYNLNNAYNVVEDYMLYLNSSEIKSVNQPYILLHGDGGIGKSHLLADVITQRNENKQKSLLFLGQHFSENIDPLITMVKMLELNCTSEKFLSILNEIGKNQKTKVIIFIDALNEGNGKHIWKNHLQGIVEKLKEYPWIGLVVSIRSEYLDLLYNDNHQLKNNLISIQHYGFSTLEYKAVQEFFKFYKISYMDIPFIQQEFRNPLFLKLLCEGHTNKSIDLSEINILDVYKNYLKKVNEQISVNCEYNQRVNIVQQALYKMVLYRYESNNRNNLIPLEDAIEIIMQVQTKYNISRDLLGELLSSGVLTQSLSYKNEEYLHITYEKLDDYSYSKLLIKELQDTGLQKFKDKYIDLKYYPDLLEILAVALSEETDYELFEIFESTNSVVQRFCSALKWRKSETITDKAFEYINNTVLRKRNGIFAFYESLILLSTKPNHALNADRTVKNILSFDMPDRDSIFIPLFDDLSYEEFSPLNRLIDWSLTRNPDVPVSSEIIRLTALMLSTLLISPHRYLRDKATKGMINLMIGRINIVIDLLKYHQKTDDPYIIERLYAVAFGCVVSENDIGNIEKLALYVYEAIFNKEKVYPNMLLRDYAKNIIEYAKYKTPNNDIKKISIIPPYQSDMPEIPSDDEIKKYTLDYSAKNFKDYWWSQNSILSSMEVEYDREGNPGGYGDFGRYTFQSYFFPWKRANRDKLDYNDLKNIAIKRIFDMGYDVEKHGHYDRKISGGRSRDSKTERIGKKYQWIALYELAAQVADNFKIEVHVDDHGSIEEQYCTNSAEPNLRKIDPTIVAVVDEGSMQKSIHDSLYKFSNQTNNEWLNTMDDLPRSEDMIKFKYLDREFILLNGLYKWQEDKKIGEQKYQNPTKDLRLLINGYIVNNEQYEEVVKFLKNKNFMGSWLSEIPENSQIYNKEYYWSETYNSCYCGDNWTELDGYGYHDSNLKVLLPTNKYSSERESDILYKSEGCSWYKPCEELFKYLNMQYGKENSVLYNKDDRIICFDSSELLKEDIGFFVDEQLFTTFLRDNNYKIIWTVLSEKRVLSERYDDKNYDQPTSSKICVYNNKVIDELYNKTFDD